MRKKSNIHPFLKMAGVKSEKEFYKKFPSDEDFFAAYPQARYGMRIADDGIGMLPIGTDVTPPAQRTMTTVPVPPMGKYVIPKDGEEDDDEEETPDQETPEQQQAKKQRKKYKLNVNAGDKTWSPFAKDNAWNTGQGVKTTDLFGTTAALASSVLPYQPARMNKPLLPLAIGSYGTGSHAAFEDGGELSPTKARMMLHDGTVHGKPITDKQRRYFGAVASGYAADGGPMITDVQPSAHTYFRPMTRQGRQVPETPNFIAADGMTMQPVTDADRQAYNNYVLGMRKLPGYDAVNWQHDQTFQKNAAQQLGFDYSKAAAIQADMMARNEMYPGTIKGIQGSDPWGGKPGWIGDRERQKEYVKYQYTAARQNPQTGVMEQYYNSGAPQFTPMTDQQFRSEVERARGNFNTQSNLPPTTNPMDPAYVAPSVPQSGPKAIGLAATGIPTRDEAVANYQARKASGQELPSNYFQEDTKKQKRMKETGDPIGMVRLTGEDVYAYGGPILGGFDARLNQNFPYPMTNQYPHKIGGQYHPYDHTRMEMGGHIPFANGGEAGTDIQVDGNKFKMLSPYTAEIGGQYHSNGGTDIMSNGQQVEAEKKETLHIQPDGTAIVGGNLYVPGTNTKFKDAFKDVAKAEKKTSKVQDKASKFLNEYGSKGIGAKNKYQSPAFNYGLVMSDEYEQSKAKDEFVKNSLTDLQNKMLELGGMIDPENGAKKVSGMFKGTAKWGKKIMAKDGIKLTPAQIDSVATANYPGISFTEKDAQGLTYPGYDYWTSKLQDEMKYNREDATKIAQKMITLRQNDKKTPQVGPLIKSKTTSPQSSAQAPASTSTPSANVPQQYEINTPMSYGPQPSGTTQAMWSTPGTESFDRGTSQAQTNLGDFADWARNSSAPSSSVMGQKNIDAFANFVMANPGKSSTEKEKEKEKVKTIRNKPRFNYAAYSEAVERPDPYQSMQVQPYLESEYNVSFQNEKNAIQSAFGPAMKAARTAGERATIAAQMAEQLQNVDAKEFQFNQQNTGGIKARNLQEMRGVRDTNLKLAMDAYEKTLGGEEAARQIRSAAQQRLYADKETRDAENRKLAMYEQYGGWQQDPSGKWHMIGPAGELDASIVRLMDPSKKEKEKYKEETDPKTGKTRRSKQVDQEDAYYGTSMAYFGEYMPIAPVRTYIAGGAVGGGMGMGMGHSAPGGMHGLPGQQGSMASRYSPGGDSSYYQKKKKKKKN